MIIEQGCRKAAFWHPCSFTKNLRTMPFIPELLKLKTVSIVGTAKNTGKTETLNYIIARLGEHVGHVCLTSIGVDGEKTDRVTQTEKPEVMIPEGMKFVTSETHYRQKRLPAEILDVSTERTALGRLIVSQSHGNGKVLLSGPSTTGGLQKMIADMPRYGVELTIVDGALSRLCPASPSVTEGMVLATGAAYSANMTELIRRTQYLHDLIKMPEIEDRSLAAMLSDVEQGMRVIASDGKVEDPGFMSALSASAWKDTKWLKGVERLYVSGVISDNLLERLRVMPDFKSLIVRDFTRVFADYKVFRRFIDSGHQVMSLYNTKLVAITINPMAPSGYRLDSDILRDRLQESLQIPVYDVRKLQDASFKK